MTKKHEKPEEAPKPQDAAQTPDAAQEAAAQDASAPEEFIITKEQYERIEKALKEREEYLYLLQRTQADFDNYRKRNASLRQEAFEDGARDVIAALLPTLDTMELAIASALADAPDSALCKGVQMVQRGLVDALQKLGLEELAALGLPFDPEQHNAVAREPAADGQKDGDVVAVLQKGYRMGKRILRPSMVKVAHE